MVERDIAEKILNAVGKDNIIEVTHCATRIRIRPKNKKKIGSLDENDIIKGSLYTNDQFQVFVDLSHIEKVFHEIQRLV